MSDGLHDGGAIPDSPQFLGTHELRESSAQGESDIQIFHIFVYSVTTRPSKTRARSAVRLGSATRAPEILQRTVPAAPQRTVLREKVIILLLDNHHMYQKFTPLTASLRR
jgi:hypothetical protein